MVRVTESKQIQYGATPATYYQLSGLHDDTKWTEGVATGSLFFEVDTGDIYAYDEESEAWNKVCALGGSGS